MIHYTCDRCKRSIDPDTQVRYVIRFDIQIAEDAANEADDDIDQLTELHMELEGLQEPIELNEDAEPIPQDQFDLCEECYRQFAKNPLGRDPLATIGFSNN